MNKDFQITDLTGNVVSVSRDDMNVKLDEKTPEEMNTPVKSSTERDTVNDLLKISLSDTEASLSRRISIQHTDNLSGVPSFNIAERRVLIRDKNGEVIEIDNHIEMKNQRIWTDMEENPERYAHPEESAIFGSQSQYESDEDYEDDLDFG